MGFNPRILMKTSAFWCYMMFILFLKLENYSNALLLLFICYVQFFVTPWTVACQDSLSMDFPGKNTRVAFYIILRKFFQSRERNHVSCIGRQILYHWATREAHSNTYLILTYLLFNGVTCWKYLLEPDSQQKFSKHLLSHIEHFSLSIFMHSYNITINGQCVK